MDQRINPPPGTPAAELFRLSDEEAQLSAREADMLSQGAEAEARAREVQSQLDEARAALQRLSGGAAHAGGEQVFLESLSLVVPPHVASVETTRALELRRKALIARLQAVEAEGAAVRARDARLAELCEGITRLRAQAATLAAQAEAAQKAEAAKRAEAERLPAPLTSLAGRPESRAPQAAAALTPPVLRPAAPPAVASRAAWIPVQPVAPPVVARPPAWSNRPTPAELQAPPVRAAGLPQEARLSPRQRVQAEVTLSSESNFFTGFSGDLSEGGVFVATYEKLLEPDTPVEVALALPGRPAVKVPGRVRWVRDTADHAPGVFPGMGISFDKVAPEALAAIKSFLQQREPMFWDE